MLPECAQPEWAACQEASSSLLSNADDDDDDRDDEASWQHTPLRLSPGRHAQLHSAMPAAWHPRVQIKQLQGCSWAGFAIMVCTSRCRATAGLPSWLLGRCCCWTVEVLLSSLMVRSTAGMYSLEGRGRTQETVAQQPIPLPLPLLFNPRPISTFLTRIKAKKRRLLLSTH